MSELLQKLEAYIYANYANTETKKLTWLIRINDKSELAEITLKNRRGNVYIAWLSSREYVTDCMLIGGKSYNHKSTEYVYLKFGNRANDIPKTIKNTVLNDLQKIFARFYASN